MNQESIFTNLPSEIIIHILSKLPIKTIITCKFVCKSWLKLLNSHYFTKSHLSQSLPRGLIVYRSEMHSQTFEIFEFKDELDDHHENHELDHYDHVTKLDLNVLIGPFHSSIALHGSTNGLIFMSQINIRPNDFYVCNPITREYMKLQKGHENFVHNYPSIVTYGFGVTKITSQYKVVRIFHECIRDRATNALIKIPKSECHVYTIGTGLWRKFSHVDTLEYSCYSIGAFLNGDLHWLVVDLIKGLYKISCLDLENEIFTTFSTPIGVLERRRFIGGLFVLEGCLCLCDNTSSDEIVIWLMKEYGDDKSWVKEYVIEKSPDFAGERYEVVRPLKVFKDGDILMAWGDLFLFYYSKKTRINTKIDMFELRSAGRISSMVHRSSFLSLNSFPMENVSSF